jgi:Rod binding domain-containing protein
MNFTHTPLTPMSLSGSHAPARSHLLPSDMAGVLTHGRHGTPGHSPLIHPGQSNTPQEEKLIEQARKWVAQTFYGTLIKQMRNSPFKSPLFEGGRGGQAFGELYDQRLVDHMSRGAGNKLVGALVRSIVDVQKRRDDNAKASAAAKAGAAYAQHSLLGPKAVSAPHNQAGANLNGKGDARPFPQKRRAPAPPDIISIRR